MAQAIKGDIGVSIIFDCGQSLATATVLQMKYKKPSGQTGLFYGSAYLTNYAKYPTASADDLDEAGVWAMQVYAEFANGDKKHTTIDQFEVGDTVY